MNAAPAVSSPFDIAKFPFIGTLVTAGWTFFNRVITDVAPAWSVLFGALGALVLAALSPNLDAAAYPQAWRRWVIYLGLGAFNALVLAGASLGGEEVADQGVDDASDDEETRDDTGDDANP